MRINRNLSLEGEKRMNREGMIKEIIRELFFQLKKNLISYLKYLMIVGQEY